MKLKKALLGVAGLTAGGLVVSRRWSRSEGALTAGHGVVDDGDHGDDWHLTDYLNAASENTVHATKSLAHCLRSARQAWRRRQRAASRADGSDGGSGGAPTSAALAADFLAALHEGPASQRPALGLQLFSQLSDWLLERAAAPTIDPVEQQAILRYLAAALQNEDSAEALLQRPGAAPRLLQLAAHSSALRQLLTAAVQRAQAPLAVPTADIQAVLQLLAAAQQQWRRQHLRAAAQEQQVVLALQLLSAWARASAANATRVAEAGAGHALADLAAVCATGSGVDGLQTLIAQLMGTLARDCAKPQQLRMQGWLYHLLCFAADATANSQWQLADAALSSFAACLLRGCELPSQLMQRNTLPLLHQLADLPGSPVRPAIALVVRALAEGPGVQLPSAERERWSEELLQWLVQLPGPGGDRRQGHTAAGGDGGAGWRQQQAGAGAAAAAEAGEQLELMLPVTDALCALAMPAGSKGLHVAHAWLAELIVHLSHQVQPYNAVPMPQAPAGATAAAAAASGGGSSSSGGSWWWPWGGSSGVPAPPAAAQGSEAAVAAAAAAAAAEGPYLSLDDQPLSTGAAAPLAPDGGSGSSWWRWGGGGGGWLPWGGGSGSSSSSVATDGAQQQAVEAGGKPSDSELALYINAAAIGPVYARSVAADLLEASGRVGAYQEPPANAEELMSPDVVAVYPQVAAAIDMDVADSAVCRALKVLCALASGGGKRRLWLLDAGILPLLHRLTMQRAGDLQELPSAAGDYMDEGIPLCIQRQAIRLLAMLSTDMAGASAVQHTGWIPWMQELAVSSDLKLSSCASRALLHIESAAATQRLGLAGLALPLQPLAAPLLPTEQQGAAAAAEAAAVAAAAEEGGGEQERQQRAQQQEQQAQRGPISPAREAEEVAALVKAEAVEMLGDAKQALGEAKQALAQVKRRLDRQLDLVRPAVPPEKRLVMQDGVHLFDPLAQHHEVLAREGTDADTSDAPLLDIVFVHGIRGGAFATWRREGVLERGQARESLDRTVCWPTAWLAKEFPEARLLSAEYAAPASGWEGESLPFNFTVAQMMDKLVAAGVGQRPVIFVSHSMGGLVVKDLLVTAKKQKDERLRRLNTSAVGAVFYSVPHAGSRLADWGWYLKYIGGSPAKHVQQLMSGPHLEDLNASIRAMCKSGQLPVLSFSEGLPTKLGYIPTHVVPHESAYPGYGEFVVLGKHDHVSVCKPHDTSDPAYARLMAFLQQRVKVLRRERAEAAAASMDHMEAAAM